MKKKTNPLKTKLFSLVTKVILANRSTRFSLLCALFVWTVWFIVTGPGFAFSNLRENWEVATTMIFGSMVAGGTSMGGGAVAFPVLTKWLQVPPHEAKVFSLAIQSIGMSAASLTIIAMGVKVEWRFIRWASLGGSLGIILGSVFLAPFLPPEIIKISFTMMVSSFAVVLLTVNRTRKESYLNIPIWGKREQYFSLLVGLIGGIISGLVGSGMDIFSFSIMLLLFGLCEKVGTPTSVILMAINAVSGFILHKFFIGDFVEPVVNYWLASVPVVVVGAPLGAAFCNLLTPKTIRNILVIIITVELITSLIFIPLNAPRIYCGLFVFILFSLIYYWMYQMSKKSLISPSKPQLSPVNISTK